MCIVEVLKLCYSKQHRRLDAVYYYIRSLTASNPFLSAKESLAALFDETSRKVVTPQPCIHFHCCAWMVIITCFQAEKEEERERAEEEQKKRRSERRHRKVSESEKRCQRISCYYIF